MKLTLQQLEAHLWGAANILRGKTAGQDYKNYILSLMFYKRLCDQWECEADDAIAELERQQGRSFSEQEKAVFRKRGEHRFQIPAGSRWCDARNPVDGLLEECRVGAAGAGGAEAGCRVEAAYPGLYSRGSAACSGGPQPVHYVRCGFPKRFEAGGYPGRIPGWRRTTLFRRIRVRRRNEEDTMWPWSKKRRLMKEFLHKLAMSGFSIGQKEDHLASELVAISLIEGFLSKQDTPGFNEDHRNLRAREIGEELHKMGGIDLMMQVRELVAKARGGETAHELDWAWHGIGEWMA